MTLNRKLPFWRRLKKFLSLLFVQLLLNEYGSIYKNKLLTLMTLCAIPQDVSFASNCLRGASDIHRVSHIKTNVFFPCSIQGNVVELHSGASSFVAL